MPDVNIDVDGDGKPDTNIDTDNDFKADINIDYDKDGKPDVNIDTDGDGKPDKNLINQDTDGDGVCDLNCDTNNDGKADINIDIDGDGIPDINIDLDGNGSADVNIDTDGDGKADTNIVDYEFIVNPGDLDEIKLETGKTYDLSFIDDDKLVSNTLAPGWKGTKEFTIKNDTDQKLVYNIIWTDIYNDFTWENRLYYGITRNGTEIVSLNSGRVPYPVNEGEAMLSNVEINPGEEHNYVLTFEFKDTNTNQDIDKGKMFYTKLQVTGIS